MNAFSTVSIVACNCIAQKALTSALKRPPGANFDEVLYAHYLSESNVNHPGKEQVLDSQENDGKKFSFKNKFVTFLIESNPIVKDIEV